MIRIQGLNKYFNKGRQNEIHVINDVSLELPERGMVAIFGKSGCGKTTLLNVIGGLDGFSSGSVTIEGQSIREDTDVIRNQYIGYIFQNYNLNKNETCFENVADALRLCGLEEKDEIRRRVMAALCNVGMEKFSERTPDTLSGGQQQRIAIARAIVKNPPIILADEPTGNLDEANTVMIMDLLRAIARDHLVLIVTHEANLVDHYCDSVIELSDGSIVSRRDNELAGGFSARDKNSIYLGELDKTTLSDSNAEIEYYGAPLQDAVKLRIVNSGGKIYLKVDSDKVHILDESSEVMLRPGVYEGKPAAEEKRIDMSELPTLHGKRFGHLFDPISSIKSGYRANFGKVKSRAKQTLRTCLGLFAAAAVIMTAVFGTAVGKIITAKKSYNRNVFYLYTKDGEVSKALNEAVGSEDSGIDYLRLTGYYPEGDSEISFRPGSFETFKESYFSYSNGLYSNAVYLGIGLAEGCELLEGKKDSLKDSEVLISSAVADKLLEGSTYGYINEYSDLIGLISNDLSIMGKNVSIAGIVDSAEPAVYLTDMAMAKYVMRNVGSYSYSVACGGDYGMNIAPGETKLFIRYYDGSTEYPAAGSGVMIGGRELTLDSVINYCHDYNTWLGDRGVPKLSDEEFFTAMATEEEPGLAEGSNELKARVAELMESRCFEYSEYYYSEIGSYLRECYTFDKSSFELWLYAVKGVGEVAESFYSEEYYKAICYRELHGRYPTATELEAAYNTLPELVNHYEDRLSGYEKLYFDEFSYGNSYDYYGEHVYLVSDSDYINLSKQIGESHKTVAYSDDMQICYTVIHSSSPEKTALWLRERYPNEPVNEYFDSLITPDDVYKGIIEVEMVDIIGSLVGMILMIAVMSVCMYFIMRSSMMNRIKEIGIYRAIGVSKKNLVFRFLVESAVISVLTVFVGYIMTSGFIFACYCISPMASQVFFYPVWLALAVLILLAALCLICGCLPIILLLRKTPSEILAKYDI